MDSSSICDVFGGITLGVDGWLDARQSSTLSAGFSLLLNGVFLAMTGHSLLRAATVGCESRWEV